MLKIYSQSRTHKNIREKAGGATVSQGYLYAIEKKRCPFNRINQLYQLMIL